MTRRLHDAALGIAIVTTCVSLSITAVTLARSQQATPGIACPSNAPSAPASPARDDAGPRDDLARFLESMGVKAAGPSGLYSRRSP